MTYRWNNPHEWLAWYVQNVPAQELPAIIMDLARHLDGDVIQDLYQTEMEKSGYFEEQKEAA